MSQAQDHEQRRREDADLLVRRQEAHAHRRDAHQHHAQDQHVLAPVRVAKMAQHKCADRPCDIPHAVRGQ